MRSIAFTFYIIGLMEEKKPAMNVDTTKKLYD